MLESNIPANDAGGGKPQTSFTSFPSLYESFGRLLLSSAETDLWRLVLGVISLSRPRLVYFSLSSFIERRRRSRVSSR